MNNPRSDKPVMTRKQLSRAQRDKRNQQYILRAAIVVTVLVVGLVLYGMFDVLWLQPHNPVARVNGVEVSTTDFEKAVRYQRFQLFSSRGQVLQNRELFGEDPQFQQYFDNQLAQIENQLLDTEGLGRQVLNQLIDDQIIRQEAAKRGITVSQQEVEDRLRDNFGYFPNGTPIPTTTPTSFPTDVPLATLTPNPTQAAVLTQAPTVTPTATFTPTATSTPGPSPTLAPTRTPAPTPTAVSTEAYGQRVLSYTTDLNQFTQLSDADFRHFVESGLYREKLTLAVTEGITATKTEIHARHILVADQVLALTLQQRVQAGEDFAALAVQYSLDTSSVETGGDLGWSDPSNYVAEFAAAATALEIEGVSAPVQSQFGWHIIQLLGERERPLTGSELSDKRDEAFQIWLQAQKDAGLASKDIESIAGWEKHVPTKPDFADLAAQP